VSISHTTRFFLLLSFGYILWGTHGNANEHVAPHSILAVDVQGSIDDTLQVESFIALIAPLGSTFIVAGDADRIGIPIGTIPRLKTALLNLGYESDISVQKQMGGIHLQVRLHPFDRVRQIFVAGNQPFPYLLSGVRQEEITRQLKIRPGQELPAPGTSRTELFQNEAAKVRDHLRSLGYWEADVRIEPMSDGKTPATVNLTVRVTLGQGYPLGPLSISGNQVFSTKSIDETLRHSEWLGLRPAPFRKTTLRQDIQQLIERYRHSGYPGVRIRDDFDSARSLDRQGKQVQLAIEVKERRKLEVVFEGNKTRSSTALRGDVTFFSRGAYDDVEAANSAASISRGYLERGHLLVKVRWRREHPLPDTERVIFTIDEGPELKVREVQFVGNTAVTAKTLSDIVRTRPFPFLGFLGFGEGGYASLKQIELDIATLTEFYSSEGYLDCKVRAEISHSSNAWYPLPSSIDQRMETAWRNADGIHVRFILEEGPLLWVAAMQFTPVAEGAPLYHDDDFLRSILRTQLGAPFQESLIKRDEIRLVRLFGDDGFRYAQVEAKSVRHGNQMQITWHVDLGPKVYVGPIFFRGNFLTRKNTILTWAELKTGDVLTTLQAERAQRNLAMIQLFNNPNPVSFPVIGEKDAVVPMVIEVEERHDHYGMLRMGAGASTDQISPQNTLPVGGYASLGYEHRNLVGLGWTLSAQWVYGSSHETRSASLLDPRLWGSLVRLELSASYESKATLRLGDLKSGSGAIGFSRELAPGVDATVRYNIRNTSRTEVLERGAGTDQNQSTVRIGTVIGSLSAFAEWHRLDNLLVPSRGFKLMAGVELALPSLSAGIGNDRFLKLAARSYSVIPLLRWLSLRHSIRYDHGLPLGGSALLPKVERFYAGGDTTIRGFQLDRALTEWVTSTAVPGVFEIHPRPMGGNVRILHNLDLQFPIAPPLFGCVFLDSGVVAYSFDGMNPSDFRHGLGVSPLLVKLPIGDLSLSFAVPLDRRLGDDRWRLHFNVGLMF
jgi:outer membrane protein insertion porin family